MKTITRPYILIVVLLFSSLMQAQVGIGTTTPNPSSVLEVYATDKGVLIPKVSLNSISNTMLDGINVAATGLLIYNTNATTTGGNGVGFYFFNGTTWEKMLTETSPSQDKDWFEEGTTNAPPDINSNMYTLGNTAFGKNLATYRLDVEETTGSRAINSLLSGSSGGVKYAGYFLNQNTGNGPQYGLYSQVSGTGNGFHFGSYNNINGAGSGGHYAVYNNLQGSSTGTLRGIENYFSSATASENTGLLNTFSAGNTEQKGVSNNFSSSSNLYKIGFHNLFNSTGTGFNYGVYSDFTGGTNQWEKVGLLNNFGGASSGSRTGIVNNFQGTGNGNQYGLINSFNSSYFGLLTSIYNYISSTGAHTNIKAIENRIDNTATGVIFGVDNSINNSNNSFHYGTNNRLFGDNSPQLIGTRNSMEGISNGVLYGTNNQVINTGNGLHYGTFNRMLGNNANTITATANGVGGSSNGQMYGTVNEVYNTGNGRHFGVLNLLDGSGSGKKYASFNLIDPAAGGTHYGVYSSVLNPNGFAGYFAGNVAIGTSDENEPIPNYYIMPASRGTNGQIMQTDGNGIVTWVTPSSSINKVALKLETTTLLTGFVNHQEIPLAFNQVKHHLGNGTYQPDTGAYTIPSSGIYTIIANFNVSFVETSTSEMVLIFRIYKNGTLFQETALGSGATLGALYPYQNFPFHNDVNLTEGDQITFKLVPIWNGTTPTPSISNTNTHILLKKI